MAEWILRPGSEAPDPVLADRLSISPFLLGILERRNLATGKDINEFLNARLNGLVNPERWPQLPEAADTLTRALQNGQKLAVWGDYDVDGTTSTTLVLDVLEFHGYHPLWHIPDRYREGYGINIQGIEELAKQGVSILLTVDSGIADVRAITRARELGMDVIVSDHHLPPPNLPPASCFFNPRMTAPEAHPCPHLAGVGVAFFLMAAVNVRLAKVTGKAYRMDNVLDLVALGTLADVMRLTGQNRLLVHGGLKLLNHPVRPGLQALKEVTGIGINAPVTATQVSFKLAPRINAAGRMRHANIAVELLRSTDLAKAQKLARKLDDLNTTRREEEQKILEEARIQARQEAERGELTGLVLYGKHWHPGVIGIVATRIIEEFHVPCVIVCDDKDTLKGSGRSVPGFDLYQGLAEIPEHLMAFGGHKQAAGVRIMPGHLEAFRHDFQKMTKERFGKAREQALTIDAVLPFHDAANPGHLKELGMLEPFGPGNPEPLFVSEPLVVLDRQPFRGRRESIGLNLRDTTDGCILQAKGWGLAADMGPSLVGQTIRIAFTLRTESRFGLIGPELTVKDWGPADKPLIRTDATPVEEEDGTGEDSDELPS